MTPQLNIQSFGLVLVSLAWAAFLTIVGSPEALLFTIPVFMLAAPLAFGRYFGDGLIEKLTQASRLRISRFSAGLDRFAGILVATIRGSLLIASNRAGRAPPVPAT